MLMVLRLFRDYGIRGLGDYDLANYPKSVMPMNARMRETRKNTTKDLQNICVSDVELNALLVAIKQVISTEP